MLSDDGEQAGELREHQGLVSFFDDFFQLFQQRLELGAHFVSFLSIEQSGVASRLAQPQQRFEHVDLRIRQALFLDSFRQLQAEVVAQFVIGLALLG